MAARNKQAELPFRRWGGARKGAGRKPVGPKAGVSHRSRGAITKHTPLHVTLRVQRHVWNLRAKRCAKPLRRALIEGIERFGMRLVHHSIQRNHLHLIVEADDARALARGMQGLCIRMARKLNVVMGKKGKVFADRYHSRLLRTPAEVRRALCYVLQNSKKHAAERGVRTPSVYVDPFSSAAIFDGWRRAFLCSAPPWMEPPPAARATSWLLRQGWRRRGLLDPAEIPGSIEGRVA